MDDPGIIRNRRKIEAAVHNAQLVLAIQQEIGSFSDFLWRYVDHRPVINHFQTQSEVPTHSPISDRLAKDLKARGFKFVGTTTIYAFMEAVGMVNDHLTTGFLWRYQFRWLFSWSKGSIGLVVGDRYGDKYYV